MCINMKIGRIFLVTTVFTLTLSQNESMYSMSGFEASIQDYPYQLFLVGSIGPCGASIVATRWALTAAHCVQGSMESKILIRGGSVYYYEGGHIFTVLFYVTHPGFNVHSRDYDAALIKITGTFPNPAIIPISHTLLEPGTNVLVIGWGFTSAFRMPLPSKLQGAYMTLQPKLICQLSDQYRFTDRMICARRFDTTRCFNDDGSPLVASNGNNRVQIGIVGFSICNPSGIDYFTNVSSIYNWIKTITVG